jgi:hypothetical protein
MKMKKEHYEFIKGAMEAIEHTHVKDHEAYLWKLFFDGKIGDPSKRLRNDYFLMAVSSKWVCDELYPYLSDINIDSSLKKIMKELGYETH